MVRSSFVRFGAKVITLFSILTSCDQRQAVDPGNHPGDRFLVAITPAFDSVFVDATIVLTARVTDALGAARTDQAVRWSSLAPSIASVDGVGLVTGVAAGTAPVVATVGLGAQAHADTAVILVESGAFALSIAPELAEITLGDTLPLELTFQNAAADLRGVSPQWASSDTSIAQISAEGVVTTLAPGDVTLTVNVNQLTATASARVLPNPAASISVAPANTGLNPGETAQLTAAVRDGRGRPMSTGNVRWSSSATAVALVTMDGQVHAKTKGSSVITATVDGRKASATVTVFAVPAASVVVTAPSNSVSLGGRLQAVATARDADGNIMSGKTVSWSSSNPAVAQVGANGLITGLVVGSTSIHAIIDSKIGSMPIAVVNATPTAIVVLPAAAVVSLGKTAQMTAEVSDQTGNVISGAVVTWASANTSIATVTGSGLVTSVATGTAVINATAGALSAQASITVIPAAIATVSVSPGSSQIQIGGTQQLAATVTAANGSQVPNAAIAWSSSNPAVVSVSALGMASGISAGNATITATASGTSGSASVAVASPAALPVSSVSVTFNSPSLAPGQQTQATAVARDANGTTITGRTVVWSSDDAPLASVSANGLVTAIAGGSATIIAKVDGVIGYATVSISAPTPLPVYTVQLTIAPSAINAGQTANSNVVLRDSLGVICVGRTIGWTSNKPFVASVGLGGVIVGVGAGSAVITATSEGKSGLAGMTVNGGALPTVATVSVTAGATSLTPSQTTQATATARDSAGNVLAGQAVTWLSSNPSAASVTATGLVTGVAVGATTVTATAGGKSGSVVITVSSPATASVTVSVPTNSLPVGQLVQAVATAKDANGNALPGKPIFWSSSNAAVATVNLSGIISGVSVGAANITASSEGKNGTVVMSITPAAPVGSVPSIAPTLPQQTVDVSWRAPTGKSIAVHAGDNLQNALNSALRGDEVVIDAGATFTGNFTLPAKAGTSANGWITVRTSALGQLPPLGSRIDPAQHAALMPKLVTPNVLPALQTQYGTAPSGWRLVGLEITVATTVSVGPTSARQQGIVVFGQGDHTQTTLAQAPRDLIIDRSYVHAWPQTNTVRCLAVNSAWTAVIGSHLVECHGKGFDSQAIAEWNGPGPFLIENNRLEAAGEVIIFGGAIANIPNLVASDITIRRNFLTRPMSWQGVWTVKNLFELKNAQRVLFEANVLENHWVDAQAGASIVLGTADNPCSWCIISDVTFQWNHIHHVAGGFNLFPRYGNAQAMRRVKIAQNLVTGVGAAGLGANGKFMIVQDNVDDVWIENNTGFGTATYVDIGDESQKPKARFTFRNNLGGGATYNWFASQGSGDAANTANLTAPFLVTNNAFIAPSNALLPTGSLRTASLSGVGFANPIWPGGNWSLSGGSSFAGLGVDYATLQARLVNVR